MHAVWSRFRTVAPVGALVAAQVLFNTPSGMFVLHADDGTAASTVLAATLWGSHHHAHADKSVVEFTPSARAIPAGVEIADNASERFRYMVGLISSFQDDITNVRAKGSSVCGR